MQRVKELDSIRGLAALAIVVYHLWFPGSASSGLAVDLFFVLSGYLITTIILDNAHGGIPRHLLRPAVAADLADLLPQPAAVVLINGFLPSPGRPRTICPTT